MAQLFNFHLISKPISKLLTLAASLALSAAQINQEAVVFNYTSMGSDWDELTIPASIGVPNMCGSMDN
jgi:hypothetical protein